MTAGSTPRPNLRQDERAPPELVTTPEPREVFHARRRFLPRRQHPTHHPCRRHVVEATAGHVTPGPLPRLTRTIPAQKAPSSPYSRHMAREGAPTTAVRLVAAGAGMVLMLAALPFFVSAGLLAPMWAVVVLDALWLALFALGLWWFRGHPYRVLALPFVAAALWLAAITAGEAFLGWTG